MRGIWRRKRKILKIGFPLAALSLVVLIAFIAVLNTTAGKAAVAYAQFTNSDGSSGSAYVSTASDLGWLPIAAQPYAQWIAEAGTKCDDVPPQIVAGIIQVESSWDPTANYGVEGVGHGLGQFMPEAWSDYGVDADGNGEKDPFNAADAIVSVGNYLCHIAETVRGYLEGGTIPNVDPPGTDQDVRNLMIVAYNKGEYIWITKEWNGVAVTFDENGIPDATHSDGVTGHSYLDNVNEAIENFEIPESKGVVAGGARERMVQIAFQEAYGPDVTSKAEAQSKGRSDNYTKEQPMGSNCQKYTDDCFAWCAAFASWIWDKGGFDYYSTWVRDFYNWGEENGSYETDFRRAQPGDTLIYMKSAYDDDENIWYDDYYHIGVIVAVYPEDGTVETIEGNSGNKVTHHERFDPKGTWSDGRPRNGIGFVAPIPGK